MKYTLLLLCLLLALNTKATTHQIGSTQSYASPNALYLAGIVQDGDTILIASEMYSGSNALAVWQANNLLIKGINGQAQLNADGQNIWGKGIWVLAGDNITVENIEFYGATVPDNNGAGIRLDGIGMTIRHCFFHDNENGILTSNPDAGNILIEYSEFANNGYGDGFTHNLYIGRVSKLTFRFNYSHHTKIGHNLKSRANENYIYYNRIMDEESGTSSRLIDLSNGGFSIIKGNLLMQGDNAPNQNLVGYGLEGLSNTSNECYFIHNTLVNKRTASCLFLDINEETASALIANNIFAGSGDVYLGAIAELNNNLIETNIDDLHFEDETNYNYNISGFSPAIDFGATLSPVNDYSLSPDSSYLHPTNFETQYVINLVDAGAYQFNPPLSQSNLPDFQLLVYPNPVSDFLYFDLDVTSVQKIQLINPLGQSISTASYTNKIDLSNFPSGSYFLKIGLTTGEHIIKNFIKQ